MNHFLQCKRKTTITNIKWTKIQEYTWLSKKYIGISITSCQYCTLHLYIIDLKQSWLKYRRWWELTIVRFRVPVRLIWVLSVTYCLQQGQKAELGSSGSSNISRTNRICRTATQNGTKWDKQKEMKIKQTYHTHWMHQTDQIVNSKL